MNQFFLHDGQNQIGPFSHEELKEKNITQETYVWKEGLPDWVQAKEIVELRSLFSNTPPAFKAAVSNVLPPSITIQKHEETKTEKTGMWIGRNPKTFIAIFVLLTIIGIAIYNKEDSKNIINPNIIETPTTEEKTPEELRFELQEKEKQNPLEYLSCKITTRKNLIGETVFEGTIINKASTASFKDIVVEISFVSKTESVISKEKFTVYELLGPNNSISISKYKTFAPKEAESFSAKVIGAKANE